MGCLSRISISTTLLLIFAPSGAPLARMEIRVMFEELLPRLRDVELTGPVTRLRSNFINGVKHMPVRVRTA